jgi:ribonuclease BN (tRNA processing enzyme)
LTERSVTVLGCDGSYPGPGSAASGYLVQGAGAAVLLDAGPGTFANLQRFGDPAVLDAVVLSHEHPDHWTDLESLAVWLFLGRNGGPMRDQPLPVYAPPGLRRHSYVAEDPRLDWREVDPEDRLELGGLALSFSRTDHGPQTLAVCIEASVEASEPGCLVYSADTGPDWTVARFGRDASLFLCEATYTREHEGTFRHLSGRQAASMAADAQVERLVLTHRWPTVSADALRDEAEQAFGRPVDQAVIGSAFAW